MGVSYGNIHLYWPTTEYPLSLINFKRKLKHFPNATRNKGYELVDTVFWIIECKAVNELLWLPSLRKTSCFNQKGHACQIALLFPVFTWLYFSLGELSFQWTLLIVKTHVWRCGHFCIQLCWNFTFDLLSLLLSTA